MKKILDKSYIGLITIFFTLYILVIRVDSTNHNLIYFIGLIIGGIFIATSSILLNKCKKIDARRMYLIAMCSMSSYMAFKGLYYILCNIIKNTILLIYFESFIIAVCITSFIFASIFLLKDLFKKGYVLNKCDMYCFKMQLNMVALLLGNYLVLRFTGKVEVKTDPVSFQIIQLIFYYDDVVIKGLLIGLGLYIIIYVVLSILEYKYFEKESIDGNQRKFN